MILAVENISFAYEKERKIIRGVSLQIPRRQMVALAGVNGCGKSTLLKLMAGILPAQCGNVYLDGRAIKSISPRERAKKMSFMVQNPETPAGFTVAETVMCGRFPYGESRRESRQLAGDMLAELGISHLAERRLAELSGGERQKVFLALALVQQPEILLLDEPFSALDPAAARELFELLIKAKNERDLAVVMVLHDINRALIYADRVVGIKNGAVKFDLHPGADNVGDELISLYGLPEEAVIRTTEHTFIL